MSIEAQLRNAAPSWAALLAVGPDGVDWIVAPPLPSGSATPAIIVRVGADKWFLFVSERTPGEKLPQRCPELHINPNSRFCLGRASYHVDRPAEVEAFWQALGEYLVNQHHAARRRRWPAGRWLSHGPDAADRQAEVEALAAAHGLDAEYAACMENDEGWIAEKVRAGGRITMGQECPRGCVDGDGEPVPFRKCDRRAVLQRILKLELARRAGERSFFQALRGRGISCCGRIDGCPLAHARTKQ
ncbi:E2 domain-containing protein [Sphingobium sp. B10D7B]|uniref:E2 domain-containing protein n=1 Tax=Sphingobium TaxID=165695 RepID=UPI0017C37065|nr:hypothetical protein [Sphingobium sp. B10D3B]MCW2400152.1 hypothetical protein [Sphingobium sp. B10D7B]MCW2407130.1 hypothetical protein [Sphingobium xanthum]